MNICLRGTIKFINSPFAIINKRMKELYYQKRNLIYENFCRRERDNLRTLNKSIQLFFKY